jgi:hypothetical protein
MFDEGYQNITNIDISHIVTKAMNDKYKEKGPNFRCRLTPHNIKLIFRSSHGCACYGV